MKEQVISFEVAKLAKEKGFDEECANYYNTPKYQDIKKDDRHWLSQFKNMRGYEDTFYNINEFKAPTQSLVQKWLRDNHNLHISINTMFGDTVVWDVYVCNVAGESSLSEDEVEGSYEKALENGILQALKLI